MLANSRLDNWYILLHAMKNSTLQFFDTENDTITLRLVDTESRYHKDNEYWNEITINVNVFRTEPPKFLNEPQTIVINSCSQSQQIFVLPQIIDSDSSIFDVTLAKDSPVWIQIEKSNQSSQSFNILIDISSPLFPKDVSNMNETLILSDDSGAFTSYVLNFVIQASPTISFQHFNQIEIYESMSVQIPLDIDSNNLVARF